MPRARPHARGRLRHATPSRRRGRWSGSSRSLDADRPDLVIVPGDVNSTLAAALTAAKMGIPVAHIESGLRSFDRTMPEELNRIVTDQLSDLLFLHSEEASENLLAEGIPAERAHFVGNTMIDTLVALEDRFRGLGTAARLGRRGGRLRARHPAPPGAGRRTAAGRDGRGPGAALRADSGRLPGPPADPKDDGGCARGRPARAPARRAARLPRLPLADRRRRRGSDRLGRDPGGDDLPRHSLLHPARQHRATGDDPGRHEHAARPRPGGDRRDPGGTVEDGGAEPSEPPPLWDGHAAERLAEVVAGLA